jgi:hypothetical protein
MGHPYRMYIRSISTNTRFLSVRRADALMSLAMMLRGKVIITPGVIASLRLWVKI